MPVPTMDMRSRNQYLHALITRNGGYHLRSKRERSRLLDEYCRVTGQHRKYVIRKIRRGSHIISLRQETPTGRRRRIRRSTYDREFAVRLISLWELFDRPCGQRLAPLLRTEVTRLIRFGELTCSEEMARKLTAISPSEIDRTLKPHKEKERLQRRYHRKLHPLLYQKIPVRIAGEQDRTAPGSIQVDLVEHCGASAADPFVHTNSSTDLATGWWEGEAMLRRGMRATTVALDRARRRYPFPWRTFHVDNDSAFINGILYGYARDHGLELTRSRPYRKNDNYLVEQKNWTHVRKVVGYLRYDTVRELEALNDLYRHELRLFKNFFQPVIMLVEKERVGGRIKRRYDAPRTPYQRVLESPEVPEETKEALRRTYAALNPAALKRSLDAKLDRLYQAHQHKRSEAAPIPMPVTIRLPSYVTQPV